MAEVKKAASSRKTPAKGTDYQIISKQSGKAIEVSDNEAVYLNEPSTAPNQQFTFLPTEDGFYQIVSRENGKALDIILGGTQNGAQIHQWPIHGGDNQLWAVESAGRGVYLLRAKASGRCLDVVGMSKENGVRIQIWDDVNGENQQWLLKAIKKAPSTAKKTGTTKTAAKKAAPVKKAAASGKTGSKKKA